MKVPEKASGHYRIYRERKVPDKLWKSSPLAKRRIAL